MHKRGLACYREHAAFVGIDEPFPATQQQLAHFAVWAIFTREFTLDTSTVKIYLVGVSVWHQQAEEALDIGLRNPRQGAHIARVLSALDRLYKRNSAAMAPFSADMFVRVLHGGFVDNTLGTRHNELLFVLLAAGPFRPNVAVNIRVCYAVCNTLTGYRVQFLDESEIWVERGTGNDGVSVYVEKDKNVTKLNRRIATLPECFFGLNLIELLEAYLLEVRPPSGGRLLACPKDARRRAPIHHVMYLRPGVFNPCNTGAYTAACEAVRRAAARAAKEFACELAVSEKYGGGTPRKTTADCLYAAGHTKKMIADVGGWALREDAADLYLRANARTRRQILSNLMNDLIKNGHLSRGTCECAAELRLRHRGSADMAADLFRS